MSTHVTAWCRDNIRTKAWSSTSNVVLVSYFRQPQCTKYFHKWTCCVTCPFELCWYGAIPARQWLSSAPGLLFSIYGRGNGRDRETKRKRLRGSNGIGPKCIWLFFSPKHVFLWASYGINKHFKRKERWRWDKAILNLSWNGWTTSQWTIRCLPMGLKLKMHAEDVCVCVWGRRGGGRQINLIKLTFAAVI